MSEPENKFLLTRLRELFLEKKSIIVETGATSYQGKIEQINEGWLELIQDQKIILVNLSKINSFHYSL